MTGPGTVAHPLKGLDYGPILEYSDDLKIDINFLIGTDQSSQRIPGIPLISREVHHHATNQYQCTRLGGLFDVHSKSCTTYTELVKVCVKVNLVETSGGWELNRTALVDDEVFPSSTDL